MSNTNTVRVGDRFLTSNWDNYRIDGERFRCDYTEIVEITAVHTNGFAYDIVELVSETNAPPADMVGRRTHGTGRGTASNVVLARWVRV